MTISIPAGDLTRTVTIDPTADLIYEGNETVIATIASVSGGNGTTIGTPDSATVTITDEQSVPTVTPLELLSLRTLQELLLLQLLFYSYY
jgi:outer membrane lipoprotein-sorting protein